MIRNRYVGDGQASEAGEARWDSWAAQSEVSVLPLTSISIYILTTKCYVIFLTIHILLILFF